MKLDGFIRILLFGYIIVIDVITELMFFMISRYGKEFWTIFFHCVQKKFSALFTVNFYQS